MYSVRLTEEVARWVFEVHVRTKASGWFISFANPTAGPWKTLEVPDAHGGRVEVHRFGREDERPDLVLVNDTMRIIVIVEAKDSLPKLASGDQPEKSARVMLEMWSLLSNLTDHPAWGSRSSYSYLGAVLWGEERPTSREQVRAVLLDQKRRLEAGGLPSKLPVLGFAVVQRGNDGFLLQGVCEPSTSALAVKVMRSLSVPIRQEG